MHRDATIIVEKENVRPCIYIRFPGIHAVCETD